MKKSLRVCWFGIYDPNYARNDILMAGLRANDVAVIACHADWRSPRRYLELFRRLRSLAGSYDLIYAAYPATVPTILAKLIARKPVIMDAFYSMHDAVVHDRQEISWYHLRAFKLWLLDWLSALCANYMVVDTTEHAVFWSTFPFVRRSKMKVIPVGVQDQIFIPAIDERENGTFLVSFHGLFGPLQGVDKIVEAAHLLRDDSSIKFRIIGSGHLSKKVDTLIATYHATNIEQIPRVSLNDLNTFIQKADVILGIFGDTDKAYRVVPNKVYQGMALRRAVITMDSPAIREFFTDDELFLIPNTPEALARAIVELKNNPVRRAQLAENGYRRIHDDYSPEALGRKLFRFLSDVV